MVLMPTSQPLGRDLPSMKDFCLPALGVTSEYLLYQNCPPVGSPELPALGVFRTASLGIVSTCYVPELPSLGVTACPPLGSLRAGSACLGVSELPVLRVFRTALLSSLQPTGRNTGSDRQKLHLVHNSRLICH